MKIEHPSVHTDLLNQNFPQVALGRESKGRPEQKKGLREEVDQNVQVKPKPSGKGNVPDDSWVHVESCI